MPNGFLYSVSWDTNTKTLSFTDKAGNIIYSCVVDIAPTLPTVSIDANPVGSPTQTLTVGDFTGPLHYYGSGGWSGEALSYDTSKTYSLTTYNDGTTSGLQACGILTPLRVSTQAGGPYYVGVKNISASSQSFMSVFVATCSDSTATVVTVYNQFNTSYNAFKYTASGTDYYYVLDGTQADWVSDLSSIGYSLSPLADDPTKPLLLLSKQNGSTVQLWQASADNDSYQTSTDGTTWTNLVKNSSFTLNAGEGVYFRISADKTHYIVDSNDRVNACHFVLTGEIEAYHNINSLLSPYFTSLTDLTTVVNSGYACLCMIFSRSKESTAATQPALKKAPLLPAPTLANSCYWGAFDGCAALQKAPDLPATYVPENAYRYMCNDCSVLHEVHIYATSFEREGAGTNNMLRNCAATGDFYCVSGVSYSTDSPSGIPTGWTRRNIT